MVDIISKRDGPRREDAAARRMIEANRGTITHLADRLTQGGYSASKAAKAAAQQAPQADGKMIHDLSPAGRASVGSGVARVKVSLNDRVVAYDDGSGRQLHLLGQIRRQDGFRYFALATVENGFLSGLPPEVLAPLAELDGQIIDAACPETLLSAEIATRLGYA
ncbi:hypothetical protein KM031_19630 (plasmid) [Gemmobacter fulvus]|uniref:Uncharacterized protein n=1 Tax=Gemmobacter fulvus TaxID=2840474 RepID=A0A975S3D9_9RHOB|nr:hypothetical protein [Gemmobacter fulvus]MBT9246488.1 hypothetical protein [Gemmobacter fulvus]QWK92587.1 hypothetical protein KM031_19630 [Gemmobacter fulvus]